MARKNDSLASLLLVAPWWVSAGLGVVVIAALKWALPVYLARNQVSSDFAHVGDGIAPFAGLFFGLLAMGSAIFARKRRRLVDEQTSLESLRQTSWKDFEFLVAETYRRRGYAVEFNTGGGADWGVDLELRKDGKTTLVQCKQWKVFKVGAPTVRELLGAITAARADAGIVITRRSVTDGSAATSRHPVGRLRNSPQQSHLTIFIAFQIIRLTQSAMSIIPKAQPASRCEPAATVTRSHDQQLRRVALTVVLAAAAASIVGCAVMPRTVPVSAVTSRHKTGILYSLPRTIIVSDLPLKQTKRSPGDLLPNQQNDWIPYATYLRTELGIVPHEIILQNYMAISVADGAAISTNAIPDKDATFYVETEVSGLNELKLDLTFGPRGILTRADISATNHTLPLVGKIGESIIGLATVGALGTPGFSPSADIQAIVTEIKAIRKSRDDALAKSTFDAEALRLYIAQLDARETKLLARLIGKDEIKLWTLRAEVDPQRSISDPHSEVIAKLHDGAGIEIVNGANRDFCPFPAATAPIGNGPFEFERNSPIADPKLKVTTPTSTTISFEFHKRPLLFTPANLPSRPDGSLYYRVPADGVASLKSAGGTAKTLVIQEVIVAQLGELRQLPRKLGGVSGGYVITLDEATGALKSIGTSSKPFDAGSQITALANKIIEKEKTDEELAALERKKKILEFEAAIRDLEKKAQEAEKEQL